MPRPEIVRTTAPRAAQILIVSRCQSNADDHQEHTRQMNGTSRPTRPRPGMRALLLTLAVGLLLTSTALAYQDLSALRERVQAGQRSLARAGGTLSGGGLQRLA